MKRGKFVVSVAVALLLACPAHAWAQGGPDPVTTIINQGLNFLGNLLGGRGAQLNELIEKKEYARALEYYLAEKQFFSEQGDKYDEALKKLGQGLNAEHEAALISLRQRLASCRAEPATPAVWPTAREDLSKAAQAVARYDELPHAKEPKLRSAAAATLGQTAARCAEQWRASAPEAFARYDFLGGDSFLRAYPIDLSKADLAGKIFPAMQARLENATPEQIAGVREAYAAVLSAEETAALANLYVGAKLRPQGAASGAGTSIVRVLQDARAAGFDPKTLPLKVKVAVLKDNLTTGAFPVSIDSDSNLEVTPITFDELPGLLASTDHLILLDPQPGLAARRMVGADLVKSRYIARYVDGPNPAYEEARRKLAKIQEEVEFNRLRKQQMDRDLARSTGAALMFGALVRGGMEAIEVTALRDAQREVDRTPQTIREPVHVEYRYPVLRAEVTRAVRVTVYEFQKGRPVVMVGDRSLSTSSAVDLRLGMHERDDGPDKAHAKSVPQHELDRAQQAPYSAGVSALLDQAGTAEPKALPIAQPDAIAAHVQQTRARLAAERAQLLQAAHASFAQAVQRAMAEQREQLAGATPDERGAVEAKLREVQDRVEEYQRNDVQRESSLASTRLLVQGVSSLSHTIEQGERQVAAARRGQAYIPTPAPSVSGQPDLIQSQLAQQMGQILGSAPQASEGYGAPGFGAAEAGAGGAALGGSGKDMREEGRRIAAICDQACAPRFNECRAGGQAACYRAAACQCECFLREDTSNSPSRNQWRQCVTDNNARASALRSNAPVFRP